MALVLVLSLAACGGSDSGEENTTAVSKNDLLKKAKPLGMDGYKAIDNMAFAKSLIGNTYTFDGMVISVEEEYARIEFKVNIELEEYTVDLSMWEIYGDVYLSLSDLASLERFQIVNFVGKLTNVASLEQDPSMHNGDDTSTELIFESAAIISDRFEATGKLHNKNTSYSGNAWDIEFPNNSYLKLVYFRDDVSTYKDKEITFSYKRFAGGIIEDWKDAYIIH